MLKLLVGFLVGFLFGCVSHASTTEALPPPCAPCKIVGSIVEQDGSVVERFRYPLTFANQAACDAELDRESFKLAVQDLQAKSNNLGQLGKEFQNLKVVVACASFGAQ